MVTWQPADPHVLSWRPQVRGEIDRLNQQLAGRSTKMTFQRGGVTVRPLQQNHVEICGRGVACAQVDGGGFEIA